jgi:hypothetical protein
VRRIKEGMIIMVRAKFQCQSNEDGIITLTPVCTGSEENESFYQYTPSGSIELGIVNENASKQFEVGKEYYVDFTPAE